MGSLGVHYQRCYGSSGVGKSPAAACTADLCYCGNVTDVSHCDTAMYAQWVPAAHRYWQPIERPSVKELKLAHGYMQQWGNDCDEHTLAALVSLSLPAVSVLKAGLEVFKTCQAVLSVVARISKPTTVKMMMGLVEAHLVEMTEDQSILELKGEMMGDRYGLTKIKDGLTRRFANAPGLILDIGANIGDFTISAAKVYPKWQVLSFEPSPETYLVQIWNLALNSIPILPIDELGSGNPGVVALHAAINEHAKDITLNYNPHRSQVASVGASTRGSQEAGWQRAIVPSYNIAVLLKQYSIPHIDLFTIDCVGCEFSLGPSTTQLIANLERVSHFASEIHWHLASPGDGGVTAHVSSAQVQGLLQALQTRNCPGVVEIAERGKNWNGKGDVSIDHWC